MVELCLLQLADAGGIGHMTKTMYPWISGSLLPSNQKPQPKL